MIDIPEALTSSSLDEPDTWRPLSPGRRPATPVGPTADPLNQVPWGGVAVTPVTRPAGVSPAHCSPQLSELNLSEPETLPESGAGRVPASVTAERATWPPQPAPMLKRRSFILAISVLFLQRMHNSAIIVFLQTACQGLCIPHRLDVRTALFSPLVPISHLHLALEPELAGSKRL